MKTSTIASLALGLVAIAVIAVPTISPAQQKSCQGGSCLSNMCHKIMSCGHKSTVYLCNSQKLYFNEKAAKQMKFMDPEGSPLIKARKIPADFHDGSSMTVKQSDH